MCSKDRKEVEAVKSELFRNGIRAEIRNNALADALRVTRVELWLQDERDYYEASKVYAEFQERGTANPKAEAAAQPEPEPEVYIDAEELPSPKASSSRRNASPAAEVVAQPPTPPAQKPEAPGNEDLAEVSGLLEKDIEALLTRDENLNARCASLENTILTLEKSLGQAEAKAGAETSARIAAEKKASEMAELQASLKRELTQRAAAEKELQRTVTKLRSDVEARGQAVAAAVTKAESQAHELKEQQTLVVALRNELNAREQHLKEMGDILTKAGIELETEKQARVAAEQRLSECAVARTALEEQAVRQTQELQKLHAELQIREAQVQAYVGRLTAIRSRLQGKR